MIRLIIRSVNVCDAAHAGGPADVEYTTFDVDLPEVEKYLRDVRFLNSYESRVIIGAELRD